MLQTKINASGIIDTVGLDHPSHWKNHGHEAIGRGHLCLGPLGMVINKLNIQYQDISSILKCYSRTKTRICRIFEYRWSTMWCNEPFVLLDDPCLCQSPKVSGDSRHVHNLVSASNFCGARYEVIKVKWSCTSRRFKKHNLPVSGKVHETGILMRGKSGNMSLSWVWKRIRCKYTLTHMQLAVHTYFFKRLIVTVFKYLLHHANLHQQMLRDSNSGNKNMEAKNKAMNRRQIIEIHPFWIFQENLKKGSG